MEGIFIVLTISMVSAIVVGAYMISTSINSLAAVLENWLFAEEEYESTQSD